MTTHITKTWFDGDKVVTQEIPESEVYKQEPVAWFHEEKYKTHFTTDPSEDMIGRYWQPLYTAPQSINDFKPDWDTVKAYDEKFAEMLDEIQRLRAELKRDPIELHVLHSHIAGVLFDFMGWLTSREKRLTLSSTDEAGPAVEAITEFAKMRDLRLEDAQVEHWQAILTTPPAAPRQWVGLTDEEMENLEGFYDYMSEEEFIKAIRGVEAKLKGKNA